MLSFRHHSYAPSRPAEAGRASLNVCRHVEVIELQGRGGDLHEWKEIRRKASLINYGEGNAFEGPTSNLVGVRKIPDSLNRSSLLGASNCWTGSSEDRDQKPSQQARCWPLIFSQAPYDIFISVHIPDFPRRQDAASLYKG